MFGSLCRLVAGALIIVPSTALAAEVEIEAEGPVIELSIFESITTEPDLVTIGAGVSTSAPTAVEAMRLNSREMRLVINRIKALGVDDKDIQTTGINLFPDYEYNNTTRENEFVGYRVTNRVSVKLREIDATGRLLDDLAAAGATNISGPTFSIEDDERAKEEARSKAVERGKLRARAYAAMLGSSEVRVLEISEAIQGRSMVARETLMAPAPPPPPADMAPVQPGQVSTGVSIVMKFEVVEDDEDAKLDAGD